MDGLRTNGRAVGSSVGRGPSSFGRMGRWSHPVRWYGMERRRAAVLPDRGRRQPYKLERGGNEDRVQHGCRVVGSGASAHGSARPLAGLVTRRVVVRGALAGRRPGSVPRSRAVKGGWRGVPRHPLSGRATASRARTGSRRRGRPRAFRPGRRPHRSWLAPARLPGPRRRRPARRPCGRLGR